ncbi:hypothetical protein [Nocardia jiangxiensis]|uniref:Uncharacterized protein n=1 Tax=Nocardia jiangxiensis TaxID=282685 RepID=A0ABW6SJA4_9NOCA|nr:hypothetical protein [Nocardia jiangxiensis]
MADDAERLAGGELRGEDAARVRIDARILHRAVTAGQVNHAVVLETDNGQLQRRAHRLGGSDDGLQIECSLFTSGHGRARLMSTVLDPLTEEDEVRQRAGIGAPGSNDILGLLEQLVPGAVDRVARQRVSRGVSRRPPPLCW